MQKIQTLFSKFGVDTQGGVITFRMFQEKIQAAEAWREGGAGASRMVMLPVIDHVALTMFSSIFSTIF